MVSSKLDTDHGSNYMEEQEGCPVCGGKVQSGMCVDTGWMIVTPTNWEGNSDENE